MQTNGRITYRLLPAEEWDKLKAFCGAGPIPLPEVAACAVAERAGEIVGALFLQLVLHMEPLVIQDLHVNFVDMVLQLEKRVGEGGAYYAFAPNAHVGRMAEIVGMKEAPGWRVYVKEV